MWTSSRQDPTVTPPIEESVPLANNTPFTGFEPNFFDDFHCSETTGIFLKEHSSDTMPSQSFVTRPFAERTLQHCSFRS